MHEERRLHIIKLLCILITRPLFVRNDEESAKIEKHLKDPREINAFTHHPLFWLMQRKNIRTAIHTRMRSYQTIMNMYHEKWYSEIYCPIEDQSLVQNHVHLFENETTKIILNNLHFDAEILSLRYKFFVFRQWLQFKIN